MPEPAALLVADGAVARLVLNRPGALNAFDARLHRDLRGALEIIETTPAIRAVIVTGAGRAFSAGQDLAERHAMLAGGEVDLSASLAENYNPLVRRIAALPCPVIAAVNGVAAGAAAAIALGCDIVLAGRSARFIFPFARVALAPDAGTSWLLPRLVGLQRALALTLTGEAVDAATAHDWGLVWQVFDDAQLTEAADALARGLASRSPGAIASIKRRMRDAASLDLDAALDAERDAQGERGRHPHYREAINAFAERRLPSFVEGTDR